MNHRFTMNSGNWLPLRRLIFALALLGCVFSARGDTQVSFSGKVSSRPGITPSDIKVWVSFTGEFFNGLYFTQISTSPFEVTPDSGGNWSFTYADGALYRNIRGTVTLKQDQSIFWSSQSYQNVGNFVSGLNFNVVFLEWIGAPMPGISAASPIGSTSATLAGSVNPNGSAQPRYSFQYWKDPNAADSTLINYPSTPVPPGGAAILDGVDDHFRAPNGAYFTGGDYTIEGWVCLRSHANWARLLDFGNGAGFDNVLVALSNGTTGKPVMAAYSSSGALLVQITSDTEIPLNRWVHLAAVRQGSTATLYMNGTIVATGTFSGSVPNVTRVGNFIGRSNWSPDSYANGYIDDVRIWNVARSQGDITTGRFQNLSQNANMVANWRFDEGNGTSTALDSAPASGSQDATFYSAGVATAAGRTPDSLNTPGLPAVDVPVNAFLTGLTPDTTYFYRIRATSSSGNNDSATLSFRTTIPTPSFSASDISVNEDQGTFTFPVSAFNDGDITLAASYTLQATVTGTNVANLTSTGTRSRYKLITGDFNWDEARQDALRRGGHLVSISNQTENDAVKAVAAGMTVFIGVNDITTEGVYKWADTSEVVGNGYKNWAPSEPNNYGGDEDVGQMYADGTWNDLNGTWRAGGYILEYEDLAANTSWMSWDFTSATTSFNLPFQTFFNASGAVTVNLRLLANYGNGRVGVATTTKTITVNSINDPPTVGYGSGFDFSPTSQGHLALPSGTYFDGSAFTVEGWVYVRNHQTWARLLDFGNGIASDNIVCALSGNSPGKPVFSIYTGTGGTKTEITSSDAIPLNTWTHLAFVYDGTSAYIYINGDEKARAATSEKPKSVTRANNYIGRSNWGADQYADMRLSEFRIWNVARAPLDLKTYSKLPLFGTETGLQVYYRGLEGAGPLVRDAAVLTSSPNQGGAQNATMSGSVSWIAATSANAMPMIGSSTSRFAVGEDTSTDFYLPAFDFETTLTPSSWSISTAAQHGTATLSASVAGRVTYMPSTNYNGNDQFTYTVSDGAASASYTVYLLVSPDNDPPFVSSIPNQNFLEGTTNLIVFTANDPEDASDNLIYTGSSSDKTVVADSGLTFGGSGDNRTLTIRPNAGESGTTTITITVKDRGYGSFPEKTVTTSFTISFEPLPAFAVLDLGTLPSYTESYGVGINDKLEVVATAQGGSLQSTRGFIYPGPSSGLANKELVPFGVTTMTTAGAINNSSLVGFNSISPTGTVAVAYNGASYSMLTPPPDKTNSVAAVTDFGTFVGSALTANGWRAFSYPSGGSASVLGVPDGTFTATYGYGLSPSNSLNYLVGAASSASKTNAFAHNGTAFTLLPMLDGGLRATAKGINSKGQIVGDSELRVPEGTTLDLAAGRYVDLPDGTWFNGSFTVEAWVYIRQRNPHDRLIDIGVGTGVDNIVISLDGGSGTGYFDLYQNTVRKSVTMPSALPLNTWVHLTAVYDATTLMGTLYTNGVQFATSILQTPRNVTRANAYLGKSNWAPDGVANYLIDNFRIFNTARTVAQIAADKDVADVADKSNLLVQYRFDEGVGITAVDSSGNGRNGALIGSGGGVYSGPNGLAYGTPVTRAVLYTDKVPKNLGTLPGGGDSFGYGLNTFGKVVGMAVADGKNNAVLFAANTLHNMNNLISDGDWVLEEARAINTQGAVVGTGKKGGVHRGYLALPATVVGRKVVRPEGAVAGIMPEIEILDAQGWGDASTPAQFFFWSPGEAKLFATRPCIARLKWFTSADLASTVRVEMITANIWPRNPTVHVVGAPVNLEPQPTNSVFNYTYQQLHYPNEQALKVVVDPSAKTYDARSNGWAVLRYLRTNGQLPDPLTQPAYFEVVRSYDYTDPAVLKDGIKWTVGNTMTNPAHYDYGRNGFVHFEKAPYDGDGADRAYDRPTRVGPIIPVNLNTALTGEYMVVDWYRTNSIGVAWASEAWRYSLSWPSDTTNKIIIASLKGTGLLDPTLYQNPRVYFQDNSSKPGYNPNEEHAIMAPADTGTAMFALRSDLNKVENISEAYALLKYKNTDGAWAIKVYKVIAEESPYFFAFSGDAGKEIQPPYPLSILPLCDSTYYSSGPGWKDYNGKLYARAAGQYGDNATLVVRYFYPMQPNFYSPAGLNYKVGDCIAWLDRRDNNSGGTPTPVTYTIHWPDDAPILNIGQTAVKQGGGLPDFSNMADAKFIFDDRSNDSGDSTANLARFYDPVSTRTVSLAASYKIPDSIKRQAINGKQYFTDLPWSLRVRLSYDPINRTLSFNGYYDPDFGVGDPLLLPNIITTQERARLKKLGDGTWGALIDQLADLTRNPNQLDSNWDGTVDKALLIGLSVGTNSVDLSKADRDQLKAYGLNGIKPRQFVSETRLSSFINRLPGEGTETLIETYRVYYKVIQPQQFGSGFKAVTAGFNQPSPVTRPLKAISFDGVDDRVVSTGSLELNNRSFTIEFWAARASDSTEDFVISQGTGSLNAGLHIGFRNSTTFTFAFYGNDFDVTVPSGDTAWHHYACTYDQGTKQRAIYRDGKRLGVNTATGDYVGTGSIVVGMRFSATQTAFHGTVDEVRIWDVARSAASIAHDMKSRLIGTEENLTLYYRFDEGSGTNTVNSAAANASGLPASATLLNSPSWVDSSAPAAIPPRFVTVAENDNAALPGLPVSLHIVRVDDGPFAGDLKILPSDNAFDERVTMRQSPDFGGDPDSLTFEWWYHPATDGTTPDLPDLDATTGAVVNTKGWIKFNTDPASGQGINQITIGEGGESGILTLSDNWFVSRYKGYRVNGATNWSDWVGDPASVNPRKPALAEGWVKRVIRNLNPFDQRISDFRNNEASTTVSMVGQAGERYEGDIAFNPSADAINGVGLIETYETVMHRAKNLSVDGVPAVNYGPANNAILLAATKIADLYTLLGNEAYADAQDPTIGFGTTAAPGNNAAYGSLASSIFAFQNQLDSLLEEELVLLRGRDNHAAGTQGAPVYNRLYWNFTQGEGEVAYQQNYNVTDQNADGFIDAKDARLMFPQGHGDAWGHYLTALKAHYDLLRHENFTWVPTTEAYTIEGTAVEVDYQDERKFARTAALKAKTGSEILDLTYRNSYVEDPSGQWQGYKDVDTDRAWGVTEWGRRAGSGALFDWLTANTILPAVDPNPNHKGIEKVDRTTVPELREIVATHSEIQSKLDMADAGLNPLGLARGVVPFDIDPAQVAAGQTHFEQVSARAVKAMNNAIATWNEANRANELLRQNQDTLQSFNANVQDQERDYKNRLIEIFGYPYAGDIGAGKTYPNNYDGPDIYHYNYIPTTDLASDLNLKSQTFNAIFSKTDYGITSEGDSQSGALGDSHQDFYFPDDIVGGKFSDRASQSNLVVVMPFTTADWGFRADPSWGSRRAPGEIQVALSQMVQNEARLRQANLEYDNILQSVEAKIDLINARYAIRAQELKQRNDVTNVKISMGTVMAVAKVVHKYCESQMQTIRGISSIALTSVPTVEGLAVDALAPLRGTIKAGEVALTAGVSIADIAAQVAMEGAATGVQIAEGVAQANIATGQFEYEIRQLVADLEATMRDEATKRVELFRLGEALRQSLGGYQQALAKGERLMEERRAFRQRVAGNISTRRYQDMTFRIFRNDALQKYRAQFDLAQRYVFLAATAYDYEVNLLGSDSRAGQSFLTDIIRQRALGQMRDGAPIAGAAGLADPLARLSENFDVLKTQLGFNNPQNETGRFSLRNELFRMRAGSDADWRAQLQQSRVANLWNVPEFRRFCRPFAPESAGAQPGLVIRFGTAIRFGENFFGKELSGGDSAYDPSRFATKISAAGVWFQNYNGNGMSLTPRIYLVPVGVDILRSPTGNDLSTRQWRVLDQALPVPFTLGSSQLDAVDYIPSIGSLGGSFADIRRFASFRGFHDSGNFTESEMISDSRLIGRSVWNTEWLLIIPGGTLLNNPNSGLDAFINSVTDIKLFFKTYSYAGN